MGTRKYIVTLTSEERECLTRLVSSGKDKAYRIKHANILLAANENGPNPTSQDIAKAFSCHLNTSLEYANDLSSKALKLLLSVKNGRCRPHSVSLMAGVKLN